MLAVPRRGKRTAMGGKMKTIIVIICILMASPAFAWDGDLYFGKYINSTLRAKPGGEQASYAEWVGGVEVGHKMFNDNFRPYVKLETLMDEYGGYAFHPSSIKYEIGGRVELWKGIYVDASHLCFHPVDSAGTVEQFNLIKMGVKW